MANQAGGEAPELGFAPSADGSLLVRLAGPWRLVNGVPSPQRVEEKIASSHAKRIAYDASGLTAWDSGVLTFLTGVAAHCAQNGVAEERGGLPQGVRRLLALAEAVPERKGARAHEDDDSLLERIGKATLSSSE